MKVYDFTFLAGQPTGAPIPGAQAGRWSVWGYGNLDTPANRRQTMHGYANEIMRMPQQPPALHRIPVLDLELCPPAEKEAITLDCLNYLGECIASRVVIIDFWPGIPADWSYPRILAALEGSSPKDRTAMFALARKHRPIIKAAGMVTVLGVIHRPDGGTGENSEYGTTYYLRDIAARAGFYREAYPGTELCVWTAGAYVGVGDFPLLSEGDCNRLADTIWANFDSCAVYGEKRHNERLSEVLSGRLAA